MRYIYYIKSETSSDRSREELHFCEDTQEGYDISKSCTYMDLIDEELDIYRKNLKELLDKAEFGDVVFIRSLKTLPTYSEVTTRRILVEFADKGVLICAFDLINKEQMAKRDDISKDDSLKQEILKEEIYKNFQFTDEELDDIQQLTEEAFKNYIESNLTEEEFEKVSSRMDRGAWTMDNILLICPIDDESNIELDKLCKVYTELSINSRISVFERINRGHIETVKFGRIIPSIKVDDSRERITFSTVIENKLIIVKVSKYMDESTGNRYTINRIKVPVKLRRLGYGNMLLKTIVDYCKERKHNLVLDVSSSGEMSNDELIKWFEKHGFKCMTDIEGYMYQDFN